MKRLLCIGEGKGDVAAVPNLCMRIFHHLGIYNWMVVKRVSRIPRSQLVDERVSSPLRPAREDGISRAIEFAQLEQADAVLVMVDADDDCPATWGPHAARLASSILPTAAVMVVREYETWLLMNFSTERRASAGILESDLLRRDPKKPLAGLVPGYKPTTHQLQLTRQLDIAAMRGQSPSFNKLVRSIALLAGTPMPQPG